MARADVPYKELLPFPTELSIRALRKTLAEACAEINKVMSTLDMAWFWKQDLHAGVAFAKENVWSRSARRRKQRQGEEDHDAMDEDERSDSWGLKGLKPLRQPRTWIRSESDRLFPGSRTLLN